MLITQPFRLVILGMGVFMLNRLIIASIFVLLLGASTIVASIINVPGDQSTIQAGIDASMDGDTVLVQPGTYVENINSTGKNIVVGSLFLTTQDTLYISSTIINGNSEGRVITLYEKGNIIGLTVTNGGGYQGGGIEISSINSDILIDNCIIRDNNISGNRQS